jgi:hypothetical protein
LKLFESIVFAAVISLLPRESFSRYGEKTLSNVSGYKWSSAFKKEGTRWRMNLVSVSRGLP